MPDRTIITGGKARKDGARTRPEARATGSIPGIEPRREPRAEDFHEFRDVPYEISIIIGRTRMTVGKLLELERGSIVELTKSAGESFDVLSNGKLIAHGDVTVMEDRFGIRINEVIEPEEDR